MTTEAVICDVCGSEMPERNGNLKLMHRDVDAIGGDYRDDIIYDDVCDYCVRGLRSTLLSLRLNGGKK